MNQNQGLQDYASPILRCAVFRRLYPGAQISYNVVPIGRAFPDGHFDYEGKATEAVKCEIVFPDGSYVVAFKEIDKIDRGKPVNQTPEQMAKDESKALGRAMRDCGVPQRLSELKILMQWISSMNGQSNYYQRPVTLEPELGARTITETIADIFEGTTEVEDDSPDAGSEDPTPEQVLSKRFSFLDGPAKAAVVKYARDELGVQNVMRAGDHVEALSAYIDGRAWETRAEATVSEEAQAAEAHDAKEEKRRAKAAASILPDEEPF